MDRKVYNDDSLVQHHYGLALEEIELERSIKSLNFILNSLDIYDIPEYLTSEKKYQERQLQLLRSLPADK